MPEIYLPNKEQLDKIIRLKSGIEPIFGVVWDKSSNPTLTRINDSVGMVAAAGIDDEIVSNDFDNAPIFGEISEVVDTLGNVFVRIPKFYIKKIEGHGFKSWQVSKRRYPGFYLPWCFWDFDNNKELSYVDIGKYKATLGAGDKLESKPGGYPLVCKNIVDFRTYAQNNNTVDLRGYQQLDIHAVDIIRTLMFVEFATLDIQSIARGYTGGYYGSSHKALVAENDTNRIIITNEQAATYRVGQTISIHLAGATESSLPNTYGRTVIEIQTDTPTAGRSAVIFDGESIDVAVDDYVMNTGWKNGFSASIMATSGSIIANDGKYPCHYRGIESPYGDVWQWVDGVNIDGHQVWVAQNADDYASNVFAHPYVKLGYANCDADGYVSEMGFDISYPFAGFPIKTDGGNDSHYCDYYYQAAGQRVALFGGRWNLGLHAGPSYWYLGSSSSYRFVSVGGRLLKKAL